MPETTTVTVLFTDVVGSTSLRQRRGEHGAQAILDAHNEIVRQQLKEHAGREVKTTGDSFMAAFDSARKAVECAIDIQRSLSSYNRNNPREPVTVRIGLHTGEAISAGGDLFGTSVDAAARIMSRAEAEQILLSDLSKTVLGSAKDLNFRPHKRVALKGLEGRWLLWEAVWRTEPRPDHDTAQTETSAESLKRTPYIGRSEEQTLFRQAIQRTVNGIGGVVLIGGEAGVGKTRLVDEVTAEAKAQGVFVVRGHCSDMEGAAPYLPFVEAIEYGLAVTARDAFRDAMGDAAPEIARFVPKVRVAYPDMPPPAALPTDQARHYMFECVGDFFERAATANPLLIVLEDLHWADVSTTQLLESVARRAPRARLLVIGTYRDIDLTRADPFTRGVENLSRLPSVTRISLRRLRAIDVEKMLSALSGRPPPEQLVRLVFSETEGVPFFVEEVYRHLAEEQRLTDVTGAWLPDVHIGEIEVPETVRLVLGRRIDRINEAAQRILMTAACIGRAFTFELLANVAEDDEEKLLDALDEAEHARLLIAEEGREPRYVFAHEQIRQTLLGRLSLARRQRLHRRVADAVERLHAANLDEHVSDLAYHLAQAGVRDRAATYLQRSGVSAAARLATPEALACFAKAADLAGPGPIRRAALRARGELLMGLFRGKEAVTDLECAMREAAADGAAQEEMEALLRLGRAYYVVGLDHKPGIAQSLNALYRARDLAVRLNDLRGEARALIPTHYHVDFEPTFRTEAKANGERALAIARDLGDADLEVDALRAVHRLGSNTVRLESIEPIAAALERRGDLITLNEHIFHAMWTFWRSGHLAQCVATCERGTALAERLGIPPVQYGTIKSFALVDLGRFDEALQALDQEVADEAHPFGRTFQGLGRLQWFHHAANYARVIAEAPQVIASAKALQRNWMVPWVQDLLALAIVATAEDTSDESRLAAQAEAAGGRLMEDALIAALLRCGHPAKALAECEPRLAKLKADGLFRNYWVTDGLRLRVLLALGRLDEAVAGADAAIQVVGPLGFKALEWRLHATRASALERLGRTEALAAQRTATTLFSKLAETLHDPATRATFLAQPDASSLHS
jgi:class 3 adenylate cyclase/tetratricopeptide (TPR) repeat protein